ncbi:MAG: 23S rRNA (pseudouridine(1915)-N(3))-methyltransferase RlmH [Oscillospiraceae bacterium]|nr:23S rRNA (pseudouridine(1915)-N(3))-methyltransferase RlmH [Oscillospiraceae bacterium]
MLGVTVLCVGKLKEAYLRDACGEYLKRLGGFCSPRVVELEEARVGQDPSAAQIERCLAEEGRRILEKIPQGAYAAALCIEGKEMDSPALAKVLEEIPLGGKSQVVFVIGGSWGLDGAVKERADLRLSMSRMTFPHQLARVMLLEQIYRGFQISSGGKYHK